MKRHKAVYYLHWYGNGSIGEEMGVEMFRLSLRHCAHHWSPIFFIVIPYPCVFDKVNDAICLWLLHMQVDNKDVLNCYYTHSEDSDSLQVFSMAKSTSCVQSSWLFTERVEVTTYIFLVAWVPWGCFLSSRLTASFSSPTTRFHKGIHRFAEEVLLVIRGRWGDCPGTLFECWPDSQSQWLSPCPSQKRICSSFFVQSSSTDGQHTRISGRVCLNFKLKCSLESTYPFNLAIRLELDEHSRTKTKANMLKIEKAFLLRFPNSLGTKVDICNPHHLDLSRTTMEILTMMDDLFYHSSLPGLQWRHFQIVERFLSAESSQRATNGALHGWQPSKRWEDKQYWAGHVGSKGQFVEGHIGKRVSCKIGGSALQTVISKLFFAQHPKTSVFSFATTTTNSNPWICFRLSLSAEDWKGSKEPTCLYYTVANASSQPKSTDQVLCTSILGLQSQEHVLCYAFHTLWGKALQWQGTRVYSGCGFRAGDLMIKHHGCYHLPPSYMQMMFQASMFQTWFFCLMCRPVWHLSLWVLLPRLHLVECPFNSQTLPFSEPLTQLKLQIAEEKGQE